MSASLFNSSFNQTDPRALSWTFEEASDENVPSFSEVLPGLLDLETTNATTNGSSAAWSEQEEMDFLETFAWSSDFLLRYSPSISGIYCLAYTIVFVMGIVGNSFVVAVVLRSPRMRTVTNYFIVNLALADILVLLFCLPATLLSNLFIRK